MREHEEELMQLRKHLADYSIKVHKHDLWIFTRHIYNLSNLFIYVHFCVIRVPFILLLTKFVIGSANTQRKACPGKANSVHAFGKHEVVCCF